MPESWEEITPQQIIAIGCTYNNSISDIAFLSTITGIRKRVISRLDNYQRFILGESFDFLGTQNMHHAFVLPHVRVGETVFYTPLPRLKGMTFGQFIFIDTWFGIYQNNKNKNDLSRFLAALCLHDPKNFTEEQIDENAPVLSLLKSDIKEALVINFLLVKKWLMHSYPLVFPEPIENEEPESKNSEPAKYDTNSWIRIYDSLVGDDIPNRDAYSTWPVNEALRYLSRKIKESIKKKK